MKREMARRALEAFWEGPSRALNEWLDWAMMTGMRCDEMRRWAKNNFGAATNGI